MILITGASGGVGAYLAKYLLSQNQEIVSIEHDNRPYDTAKLIGVKDRIIWVRGSITDPMLMKRILSDYNVKQVYHLAALPIVQASVGACAATYDVNLMGTIHLLDAIREMRGVGRDIALLYVSSDKVYGNAGQRPYTEDMPLNSLGVYESSKAAADRAVQTYLACGFISHAVVVRPSNFIIPADINFARVLPRLIIPCMRGDKPILYKTQHLREYTYIEDGVIGMAQLLNLATPKHTVYNMGSGYQRSMAETVNAVLRHFPGIGEPAWIETPNLSRQCEIPYQRLDSSRLLTELTGWLPTTSFEEGVEKVVTWWRGAWDRLPMSIRNWQVKDWHG